MEDLFANLLIIIKSNEKTKSHWHLSTAPSFPTLSLWNYFFCFSLEKKNNCKRKTKNPGFQFFDINLGDLIPGSLIGE